MAFSKASLYTSEENELSEFAHSISHPARPKILFRLALEGNTCVEDLTEEHPLQQSSISQHLEILRKVSLVNYEEKYPYTFYSLEVDVVKRMINDFRVFLDALEKLIAKKPGTGEESE